MPSEISISKPPTIISPGAAKWLLSMCESDPYTPETTDSGLYTKGIPPEHQSLPGVGYIGTFKNAASDKAIDTNAGIFALQSGKTLYFHPSENPFHADVNEEYVVQSEEGLDDLVNDVDDTISRILRVGEGLYAVANVRTMSGATDTGVYKGNYDVEDDKSGRYRYYREIVDGMLGKPHADKLHNLMGSDINFHRWKTESSQQ